MHSLDPQSLPDHLDALYRAARALCRSQHDAEDLVQDTFASVLAKPRLLRGDDRVYLMRALRNVYFNRRRTAARRPLTATLEGNEPHDRRTAASPEEALIVKDLYRSIADLPEDFRLVLVAVDLVGLSYAEAGRALGVREATVATRVYRARKRLAETLRAESDHQRGPGDGDERRPDAGRDRAPVASLDRSRPEPGGGLRAEAGRGEKVDVAGKDLASRDVLVDGHD